MFIVSLVVDKRCKNNALNLFIINKIDRMDKKNLVLKCNTDKYTRRDGEFPKFLLIQIYWIY
jgi:hypothetical protein